MTKKKSSILSTLSAFLVLFLMFTVTEINGQVIEYERGMMDIELIAGEKILIGDELALDNFGCARRFDFDNDNYPDDRIGTARCNAQPGEIVEVLFE